MYCKFISPFFQCMSCSNPKHTIGSHILVSQLKIHTAAHGAWPAFPRHSSALGHFGTLLEPEKSCRWIQLTIWLFNIAMENPQNKWRYLAGKIIYFYGPSISHGYVSHNQRVDDPTVRKGQILPGICAKSKVLHKQKTANPWLFEWEKMMRNKGIRMD